MITLDFFIQSHVRIAYLWLDNCEQEAGWSRWIIPMFEARYGDRGQKDIAGSNFNGAKPFH